MCATSGQSLVEATAALWILFLVFVCMYYIFLMSIDKIRSLDTAYHLARAQQVQPLTLAAKTQIMLQCFGRAGLSQTNSLHAGSGLSIDEITFQFLPHTLQATIRPWQSVMRVTEPNRPFLSSAWPGAPTDPPASAATLAAEALEVQL